MGNLKQPKTSLKWLVAKTASLGSSRTRTTAPSVPVGYPVPLSSSLWSATVSASETSGVSPTSASHGEELSSSFPTLCACSQSVSQSLSWNCRSVKSSSAEISVCSEVSIQDFPVLV